MTLPYSQCLSVSGLGHVGSTSKYGAWTPALACAAAAFCSALCAAPSVASAATNVAPTTRFRLFIPLMLLPPLSCQNTFGGRQYTRKSAGRTQSMLLRKSGGLRLAALAALFVLAVAAGPSAHEIPNDVTVQSFVKPEGQRLRLLVRVPLIALR